MELYRTDRERMEQLFERMDPDRAWDIRDADRGHGELFIGTKGWSVILDPWHLGNEASRVRTARYCIEHADLSEFKG